MDAVGTEVEVLRDEVASLRKEMEAMRAQRPAGFAASTPHEKSTEEAPSSNRRNFLKLAGAAAAGATVVAVAGTAQQAAALTGGNMIIGETNTPSAIADDTRILNPSSSNLMPVAMHIDNYSSVPLTLPSTHRIAMAAVTSSIDGTDGFRTGVYGRTAGPADKGGQGVFGSHEGMDNDFSSYAFGVVGTAKASGYGVFGYTPTGTDSVGVIGRADAGVGVIASSFTGVSLLVRDGGRLQHELRAATGAPISGSFSVGEQIRDAAGDMYICTASGSPGTWRKVTANHPAYANSGGSINMLSTPIRVFDTRPGTTAPLNNAFAKVAGNTALTLQITGTVVGGISVPAGAKGVLGNLTIIGPAGDGYAQIWPSGAAPTTSNINYGVVNANPALANSFICGLDATGKLKVLTFQTAHVLVDIAAFVF